jgi:hypothetical protein
MNDNIEELREINRLDRIIAANSIYPPESRFPPLADPELGDDLPFSTGQIWAACGVLVVVLLAIVFGGAWMGVQ